MIWDVISWNQATSITFPKGRNCAHQKCKIGRDRIKKGEHIRSYRLECKGWMRLDHSLTDIKESVTNQLRCLLVSKQIKELGTM
jgi:hypothetical protein